MKYNNFKLELHTSECLVLAGHQFYSKTKVDKDGNSLKYYTIDYYSGYNRREGNYNLVAFSTFCTEALYKLFLEHGAGFYNLNFNGSGRLINADFISDIIRNK